MVALSFFKLTSGIRVSEVAEGRLSSVHPGELPWGPLAGSDRSARPQLNASQSQGLFVPSESDLHAENRRLALCSFPS